ncbi:MAG: electron transfer flavoprotein subunit alpha [Bacteroidetes bacterium GWF2_38_335]|nr:MAG: electron transfer flavoprotein subunit alpha [Bacteroidetes bacterium GWF2_38_335]OFY77453.1 MAG: electron transfer flavoprotein subunit alpha [Bacteroidetes bacterium RIFOXYA12_FULL_38_20]HBS87258.1 electron transfer flavoprotein subunit alpha [Bacteroidales bacterium]
MAILVYTENWEGKFKKLSYELVSYAAKLAEDMGTQVVAVSIGNTDKEQLKTLGKYGASKVIAVCNGELNTLHNRAYTAVLAQVAQKENAKIVVLAHNNTGKALAPRLSVKLKAGLVSGVVALPISYQPVTFRKKSFNGSAFANVKVNSPSAIVTLFQNSYEIVEKGIEPTIEEFVPTFPEINAQVTNVDKVTGKILLTDAEIVVSGGRGMKGPENWAPIEEFASLLGAATACSRPVSDENWRPHSEHVGQTGKIIAPNLYFALGISGAIQHLGGVSSSKCIVAVNTDKDAPIFEAANYGIIGDVKKVLPDLVAAYKEFKAS